MGQEGRQFLIVFLFLAAAAFLRTVTQMIIGYIHFIPAVTPAVPDEEALPVLPSGRMQRHQFFKPLSGYIRVIGSPTVCRLLSLRQISFLLLKKRPQRGVFYQFLRFFLRKNRSSRAAPETAISAAAPMMT